MVFVTLEDETGSLNVVVWQDVANRQRRELLEARLMAVDGVLEKEGEVVHLIARRLTDHSAFLKRRAQTADAQTRFVVTAACAFVDLNQIPRVAFR